MKSKEGIYAARDELSAKQHKVLHARFKKLGVKMAQGKNTQFTDHDLLRALEEMSRNRKFAESTSERLRQDAWNKEREGYKNVQKAPTGNWILGKIRDVDPASAEQWCSDNVRHVANMAKEEGLVRRGCTVAADITNIPYYGKTLIDSMRTSKPKNGTSKFYAHVALHTVTKDYNVALDARTVPKDAKMHEIVLQMMKSLDRQGLRPGTLVVDRELYTVAAINALESDHRDYLMPAVKNSRIKRAIKEVDKGKRNTASSFSMTDSKTREEATFNLLIIKKDEHPDDALVEDRYVAFATNLPIQTQAELVEALPKEYRTRWIIETGFRTIKDVMAKTCSRYLHVRLILINLAFLLYGLWRLGQYHDLHSGNPAGGKSFTISLFVQCLSNTVMRLLRWEKEHGNFKAD